MSSVEDRVEVLVSVHSQHMHHIREIAEQCRSAGLVDAEALDAIGAITGFIASNKIDQLSRLDGVSSVERSESYRIAPPDADIQ